MSLRRLLWPAVALVVLPVSTLTALLASPTARAQAASARMPALQAAFTDADAGRLDLAQAARFARDPLYPWLQATIVRKNLRTSDAARVQRLLDQLGDTPAGRWLRPAWLGELARREDWARYAAAFRGSDDAALRCHDLRARMGGADGESAAWIATAKETWLTGQSLPNACDPVMERLAQVGAIDDALRWQRIDLAIAAGEGGLVRYLAPGLSRDAALATAYASYMDAPSESPPAAWMATARGRSVVASGLAKLARRDPDRADRLLRSLPASGLDEAARGQVAYQVALWTVASYLPGAAQRLAAVPASAYDDKLHEWRVREAMARGDDAGALAAIGRMGDKQRADEHWQYFEARLRERAGQKAQARALYAEAARKASFHGWLAAERLGVPYTLCAIEPPSDAALRADVAGNPGLRRALDLFALDRIDPATREWAQAVKGMDDARRRLAVQRAIAVGWFDRSVFGMGVVPEDNRHYSLRFPLHHADALRRHSAAQSLDPAWVAAQTRSESSFMPKARSGADARGLMQLLPGTGQLTARRLGIPWRGGESLYEPDTNLRLGTAYLRQMLDRYDGKAWMAIAAYNAGPSPVDRWRAARGHLDPDFFIETIPYKETREYVARVLAFSVVYDWRLDGDAAPLSQRMLGRLAGRGERRAFQCEGAAP
jgi:soluble lytic murein transglycosylase